MNKKPINLSAELMDRDSDKITANNILRAMLADNFDEIVVVGIRYDKEKNDSYKTAYSALGNTHQVVGILTELINDILAEEN